MGKTVLVSSLRWGTILVLLVLLFFPIYTLLRTSFAQRGDLYARPFQWIPENIIFDHFVEVLRPGHIVPIFDSMANSFVVSLGTAVLSVLIGSLAAYALARLQFAGRNALLTTIFAVYILPGMLFLIPIFGLFKQLRLLDNPVSLIITYTAFVMPFIVIIMRSYFVSIPSTLEEASRIDGCNHLQTFTRIILPLSGPGLVAGFVSAFILAWNEFLAPLVLTSRYKVITTTLGQYSSTQDIELGQMAAAGIYSLLPVVVIALVLNRYIRRGIVEGAVKG